MPENPEQPDSTDGEKGATPLILVVGDTVEYPRIFELLSAKLNVTVHIAKGCREAIHLLERGPVDLVVMDWLLPDADGILCAQKIRLLEEGTVRRTPIIGITGHIRANPQTCFDAGMDDYLAMPFTYEQLHAKLKKWLTVPQ